MRKCIWKRNSGLSMGGQSKKHDGIIFREHVGFHLRQTGSKYDDVFDPQAFKKRVSRRIGTCRGHSMEAGDGT